MDQIKPIADNDLSFYQTADYDLPISFEHTQPTPAHFHSWSTVCQEFSQSPLNFQPNIDFLNESSDIDFQLSGCAPDQIWLVCKGANTSSACYADSDLIDFADNLPPKYAYTIYGIVFPCLVTLAIVANVFILLVLSQKHMQSPTNVVLKCMSLADLFVGIVPLPFTLFWFTLQTYSTPRLLTPFWCYVYHYVMDTIPPICHNVAIWLTVLLAAQRYVYIEFPLKAHCYCTLKDVKRVSIAILIVSTICGAMKLGDCVYDSYSGYLNLDDGESAKIVNFTPGVCLTRWSSFVKWIGVEKYLAIYFWIRATLFVWIPCLLLIFLNVMLIRALHETRRRRQRLFSDGTRLRERQKESYTTSTMLVAIVSVFLVVNLPQGLFVALITADQAFDLRLEFLSKDGIAPLILMIDNMLIIATYPLNFAIYCSMSTLFRDTFKRLFLKNLPPLTASRRASSFTYCSYAPVGTVVPVVQEATATATLIFQGSPSSSMKFMRHYNSRTPTKEKQIFDTNI